MHRASAERDGQPQVPIVCGSFSIEEVGIIMLNLRFTLFNFLSMDACSYSESSDKGHPKLPNKGHSISDKLSTKDKRLGPERVHISVYSLSRDLRHPHIALLMAVCSGPCREDMFIALEPLHTSSLYTMMHKEHRKFSHSQAVSMLSDITRGRCTISL